MAASAWEEVKRLAADFQRAQLSTTIQRLSERNCVEIVSKLIRLNLIDVVYTTDGKEYMTLQEVTKEIHEELVVKEGRINLVELQQLLRINFNHIETKVNEIVKNDGNYKLVLGQLINRSYLDRVAQEINDSLQEHGQITISECTKIYDLPADFLQEEIIDKNLGSVIQGKMDNFDQDLIFTQSFITRHHAKVRGAFSALTKPTPVQNILNKLGTQERIFLHILEELTASHRLPGKLSGPRKEQSLYIPDIYTRTQNQWVSSFFKQNGYLEYDNMSRLGISDAKTYIKKSMKDVKLQYLETCCVGQTLLDNIEAMVDETLQMSSWVDSSQFVPSFFSKKDSMQLLQMITKTKTNISIFSDTIVAKNDLITKQKDILERLMPAKAERDVKANPTLLATAANTKNVALEDGRDSKKSARQHKASGSSKGGGTQGRETKTKAVKKKGRGNHGGDADFDEPEISSKGQNVEFMSVEEIVEKLQESLSDAPDEFIEEIASELYRPLKKLYQEALKSVYLQTTQTATTSSRRKIHTDLQEKINGLFTNIKLFQKGISFFDDDVQEQLSKHLLKSLCTDVTNLVFREMASENMMALGKNEQVTAEARVKILNMLPDNVHDALTKLNLSLNDKSVDTFLDRLEAACRLGSLEILLKPLDKKKERQLIFNHRHTLTEQLNQEQDSAMTLHLATVILFQTFSGSMLHMPGRCVPHLVKYLGEHMSSDSHNLLIKYQDLVIKRLKQKSEDGGADDADVQLSELNEKLKELASSAKKSDFVGNKNDV